MLGEAPIKVSGHSDIQHARAAGKDVDVVFALRDGDLPEIDDEEGNRRDPSLCSG